MKAKLTNRLMGGYVLVDLPRRKGKPPAEAQPPKGTRRRKALPEPTPVAFAEEAPLPEDVRELARQRYEAKLPPIEQPTRELFVYVNGKPPAEEVKGVARVVHCDYVRLNAVLDQSPEKLRTVVLSRDCFPGTTLDYSVAMGRLIHGGVRLVTDAGRHMPVDEVKDQEGKVVNYEQLRGRWLGSPLPGYRVFDERRWSDSDLKATRVRFGYPNYWSRCQLIECGLTRLISEGRCLCNFPLQLDAVAQRLTLANLPDDYLDWLWRTCNLYGEYAQRVRQYCERFVWPFAEEWVDFEDRESEPLPVYPRHWQDLSAFLASDAGWAGLRPDERATPDPEILAAKADEQAIAEPTEVTATGNWRPDKDDAGDEVREFVSSIEAWQDTFDRLQAPSPEYRLAKASVKDPAGCWRLLLAIDADVSRLRDRLTSVLIKRDVMGLVALEKEAASHRDACLHAWQAANEIAERGSLLFALEQRDAWRQLLYAIRRAWWELNAEPEQPEPVLVSSEELHRERRLRRKARRERHRREGVLAGKHCYPPGRPRVEDVEHERTYSLLVGPRYLTNDEWAECFPGVKRPGR